MEETRGMPKWEERTSSDGERKKEKAKCKTNERGERLRIKLKEKKKKHHSESRKQECWTVAVGRSGFIFFILSVTVEFFWPVSARARACVSVCKLD